MRFWIGFFLIFSCPYVLWSFDTSLATHPDIETSVDYNELILLHERFWDAFVFPASTSQLLSINSSLFSEDVVGRVDAARTYIGRELNTEYVFGTFSENTFNAGVKTLIGAPLSHQTIRLATGNNLVSASKLVFFNSSFTGSVTPIQIDIWMAFNSHQEIELYDITFRWFSWLFDDLLRASQQEQLLNATPKPEIMAEEICLIASTHCTGSLQQYSTYEICLSFLVNEIRFGASYEFGRNTLLCRNLHAKLLPLRPEVHCPHIGPSGGDMCVDRLNYQETVLQPEFLKEN